MHVLSKSCLLVAISARVLRALPVPYVCRNEVLWNSDKTFCRDIV